MLQMHSRQPAVLDILDLHIALVNHLQKTKKESKN